jgi:D-alanine-D-alanine ligase
LQKLVASDGAIGKREGLVARLAEGSALGSVVHIAEGLFGLLRDPQIPALLDAYQPLCFQWVLCWQSACIRFHQGGGEKGRVATAEFCTLSHPRGLQEVDLPIRSFSSRLRWNRHGITAFQ